MRWPALIVALLALGLLLAWADSTIFQSLFPNPFPAPRPRARFRPPEVDVPLGAGPGRLIFPGLGPVGGLYSFGWFLAAGAGLILIVLAVLVTVPGRVRRASQRIQPGTLSLFAVAGVATLLLVVAVSELLRTAFIPLGLVPILWAVSLAGIVFGIASLALSLGRWLRTRLGPAPPLLAALAAVLVLLDVVLIPVAGWVALAAIAIVGLGVALVTRMGSRGGWSLEELEC